MSNSCLAGANPPGLSLNYDWQKEQPAIAGSGAGRGQNLTPRTTTSFADGQNELQLNCAGRACRQLQVALVEFLYLLVQFLDIAVVDNDIIGGAQARGPVCLRRQDRG